MLPHRSFSSLHLLRSRVSLSLWCSLGLLSVSQSLAMGLMATPDAQRCAADFAQLQSLASKQASAAPALAKDRLKGSTAVLGSRDVAWAWLALPTARYPHASMGSVVHAGSLFALSRDGQLFKLDLPKQRVFEDLEPRITDLDGDRKDEIIVIEADADRGAALVSYGLRTKAGKMQLQELARSSYLGLPFRWLSPVGFADFDGDGQLDIASVTTPHIGGVLTLYRYAPPRIEPFAKAMDVSNHQMGDPNLQMHAILNLPGQRPTVIVPDMSRRALHALRWVSAPGGDQSKGEWKELADVKPLPGRVQYLMPSNALQTACAQLHDGSWWRIDLTH
jgi:FG-GAP-like repeat